MESFTTISLFFFSFLHISVFLKLLSVPLSDSVWCPSSWGLSKLNQFSLSSEATDTDLPANYLQWACTELPESFPNQLRVKSGLYSWGLFPYRCQTQLGTCVWDLERKWHLQYNTWAFLQTYFPLHAIWTARVVSSLTWCITDVTASTAIRLNNIDADTMPQLIVSPWETLSLVQEFRFPPLASEPLKEFQQNTTILFCLPSSEGRGLSQLTQTPQKCTVGSYPCVLMCFVMKPMSLHCLQKSCRQVGSWHRC